MPAFRAGPSGTSGGHSYCRLGAGPPAERQPPRVPASEPAGRSPASARRVLVGQQDPGQGFAGFGVAAGGPQAVDCLQPHSRVGIVLQAHKEAHRALHPSPDRCRASPRNRPRRPASDDSRAAVNSSRRIFSSPARPCKTRCRVSSSTICTRPSCAGSMNRTRAAAGFGARRVEACSGGRDRMLSRCSPGELVRTKRPPVNPTMQQREGGGGLDPPGPMRPPNALQPAANTGSGAAAHLPTTPQR